MDTQHGLVLLVKNARDTMRIFEEILKFKGYRTGVATNGREALEFLQKERPALIIADVIMPKMDGFSLLLRLRSNPVTQDIPMMLLTHEYILEDRAFAFSLGVTHILEKPVDVAKFVSLVDEVLEHRQKIDDEVMEHRQKLEVEFYNGYIKRIEMKLRQKNTQIDEYNNLSDTSTDEEKSYLQDVLQRTINEAAELERLFQETRDRLGNLSKTDEKDE